MQQILTATKLNSLAKSTKTFMTSDGAGLYFRKRKNSASWVIRRTRNKVASFTTIGRYPEMSLAEARRALRRFGNQSADKLTVLDLLDDWYDQNRRVWRRPEQMAGYIRRLSADDPELIATNIALVTLMAVRKTLRAYAKSHGNIAANRLMEILKNVFKHAVQSGYLKHSPIDALDRKVVGGVEKPRQRVLTDNEIGSICASNRHADLFRFLLLTGQRIRETQVAHWADIDQDRWFIPARNNKSDRDHWVALSRQAKVIINRQPRNRSRIFGVVSETAVQAYLKRWCIKHKIGSQNIEQKHQGNFTPHDFRRTFATRLNELGVGPHIVEKILNHRLSGVMAVYNQADYSGERTKAMQMWADEIQRIIGVDL